MNRLNGPFIDGAGAFGLLVIRLVCGLGLMLHGWPKIQEPFAWMGTHATVPGFFQALSALAEFGGGLALILGLLTPLACLGILANMAVAMVLVHLPKGDPFVGQPGGPSYELALIYFAVACQLLFTGPGTLSLDFKLFPRSIIRRARLDRTTVSV
ncbi:MAG: DoxX family protein [Candidatus Obscuribacterales bacterium]|nr:DoxX family protein [Candidatus Obscuribacterales bacterium]